MMSESRVPTVHVVGLACWAAGLAVVLIDLATGYEVGQLGLMVAGVGLFLNIKGSLVTIYERERAAFDLGRESVQMRSVRQSE